VRRGELTDIMKRIKWVYRGRYDLVEISYIERLGGNEVIKELSLNNDIELSLDRIVVGDKVIPIHRVVAIKVGGKVVWERLRSA